jgi:hypothetical protein
LVGAELVRLAAGRDFDYSGRDLGDQTLGYSCAGVPAGFVAVHQQNGFVEAIGQKFLLPPGKGAPHQGDDAWESGLVHLHAVKKALHKNDRPAMGRGAVEIEEYERFSEPRRETISRF